MSFSASQPSIMETRESADAGVTAPASSFYSERLCWRVHLLRREPQRLLGILLVLFLAGGCVWLMFGVILPVLAALLLLLGSVSEYLCPVSYRMDSAGVATEALTSRISLPWSGIKRCVLRSNGMLLTTLLAPSRLDAFRGILLRFAPEGEPGDKSSVLTYLAQYAPELSPDSLEPLHKESAQEAALEEASLSAKDVS